MRAGATRVSGAVVCCAVVAWLGSGCGGNHRATPVPTTGSGHAAATAAVKVTPTAPRVPPGVRAVGGVTPTPTTIPAVPPEGSYPDLCDRGAVERAARERWRSASDRRFLRAVSRQLGAAARAERQPGAFKSGCSSIAIPVYK